MDKDPSTQDHPEISSEPPTIRPKESVDMSQTTAPTEAEVLRLIWCPRRRHSDMDIVKYHKVLRERFSIEDSSFTAICIITRHPLSNTRPVRWALHVGQALGYVFAGVAL